MIVRDEEQNIERCVASVRDYVEEVVIVDTGSKDRTPEIAKRIADVFEVFTDCNGKDGSIEDFGMARNRAFSLGTQKWRMWVDGDDEIQGADKLAEIIAFADKSRNNGPCQIMLPYEYDHDETGACTCIQSRERLCTPWDAFQWVLPVHEIISPRVPSATIQVHHGDLRYVHRRRHIKKDRESGRNLRILKKWYGRQGEADVRMIHYLGREYGGMGEIENAIKYLTRFVQLSGWDEEKCEACLEIVACYEVRADYENALSWGYRALKHREWFESYYAIMRAYYFLAMASDDRRQWERCVHFGRMALACPPTATILFVNTVARDIDIHVYLNYACNKINDIAGALLSARTVAARFPNHVHVAPNLRRYERSIAHQEISVVLDRLVACNATSTATRDLILRSLDSESPDPEGRVTATGGPSLNIVFACGDAWEEWNPKTAAEKGIGGSETAVIEMAKRLAAKGHRVRVFTSCGPSARYDGVEYSPSKEVESVGKCDVLIAWRHAQLLEGVEAPIKFLWVHDIFASGMTPERARLATRVLALSQWHRDFLIQHHGLPPEKVICTRNGVDLARFDQKVERNTHKLVVSSSPDRYLPALLDMWPRIRKLVPDAELHVFYGFTTWESIAKQRGEQEQLKLIREIRDRLVTLRKDGVHFRDRVNQEELAREYLSAGVFPYSTWFMETSCISSMEAQAAGLRIVTSPIAALNETVGPRGVLIPGDWLSKEYQDAFVEATIDALTKPGNEDREALQAYARANLSWDGVADDWEKLFRECLTASVPAPAPAPVAPPPADEETFPAYQGIL